MADDTDPEPTFDEDDIGASIHDVGGGGEIGTIADYDDERVYVEPSEDFDDDEKVDAIEENIPGFESEGMDKVLR